jgi:twitching motility two-component system response regulator PilH
MAMLENLKRMVNAETEGRERRVGERVRSTLGARILVVDDSATIRAVLGKMLSQDGYQVMKAADGETAVDMAQAEVPDLIFLDIVLPGMSGFSVLRALRRDPRTERTPIVMMSGNQQATEQFYVQRFGADGFMRKPFGRAEVFHAIRVLVQEERMPERAVPSPPQAAVPERISAAERTAVSEVTMPDRGPAPTQTVQDAGDGVSTPAAVVPEGISAAERTAVPEVAMPDHGPAPTQTVQDAGDGASAPAAALGIRASAERITIPGGAISLPIRPTLTVRTLAASLPWVTFKVAGAQDPVAKDAAVSIGASAGPAFEDRGN